VEYSPTTSYGSSAAFTLPVKDSSDFQTASLPLTGLTTGTTYHYRLVAQSASGTATGQDQIFRTLPALTASESWRQTHFGTTAAIGDAAEDADPDGDGLVNLIERAFGLAPLAADAASQPRWAVTPAAGGSGYDLSLVFSAPPESAGLTFIGEWSTLEGSPAVWTPLPDTGTPPEHRFTLPWTGLPRVFAGVRVVRTGP
jgi:hypothetical protein